MKSKHLILLGHLDHGKSSLLGRLLWDLGKIDRRTKTYLKEIGGKQGRQFAFVLDHRQEERSRRITIDVAHNKLLIDGYSFTFADAPGHQQFQAKTNLAINQANGAIIVIDVTDGIKDQTKTHLLEAQKRKIADYLVCITKMDLVNYREEKFTQLANQVLKLLNDVNVVGIIPVSALKGENIINHSSKMAWFQGSPFLESLKKFPMQDSSVADLIRQTEEILLMGVKQFKRPVMLWAGGKDSTAQIAIAKNLFGKLPFPVMFIDTTYKFTETYDFISRMEKEWQLNLIRVTNRQALA